jgi:hypothetical protein
MEPTGVEELGEASDRVDVPWTGGSDVGRRFATVASDVDVLDKLEMSSDPSETSFLGCSHRRQVIGRDSVE